MEALFYLGLICVAVLFWIATYLVMRWAERRFPTFSRWLDRHVGPDPEWRQW